MSKPLWTDERIIAWKDALVAEYAKKGALPTQRAYNDLAYIMMAEYEARIAELEARLAQTWTPLADGEVVGLNTGETTLTVDCAYLWTRDDEQSIVLPEDVNLCRLRPQNEVSE